MPVEVFAPKEWWEYQSKTPQKNRANHYFISTSTKSTNLQPRLKPMQTIQCQKYPNILQIYRNLFYMLQDPTKCLIVGLETPHPIPCQSQGPILLGVERGSVSPVPSCPRSLAPDGHETCIDHQFCALEPEGTG